MSVAIITGSSGLVGSAAVRRFATEGYEVVGIDNNMRAHFFGLGASTHAVGQQLEDEGLLTRCNADIRDAGQVNRVFRAHGKSIGLVVHCAAQPAHDWAAKDPTTDFEVNAVGTLNVLEATRSHTSDAPFVHCSTSKVYGANPNDLPLTQLPTRFDLPKDHPFWNGITPEMSIDRTTHSLFGVSKASGDLLVQEYGRYFETPTVCFRPGCLTGPQHAGAELHGFLSYLMKCAMTGHQYTVFGYFGRQVRCNLHADDLVRAFSEWAKHPGCGDVYNIGGGRASNCSMAEAIKVCEDITGARMNWRYSDDNRIGDHMWWISDNGPFERNYPDWPGVRHDTFGILSEIYRENLDRWQPKAFVGEDQQPRDEGKPGLFS